MLTCLRMPHPSATDVASYTTGGAAAPPTIIARASYTAKLRPVLRILEPVEGCEATFLYLLEESWNGVAH